MGPLNGEVLPEPVEHRVRANGIELAFFEWGHSRRREHPTILLLHATGFHARCWDQVVRHLGDRHVIAVDQRGHGRSDKPAIEHWNVFGRDVAAFVQELDLKNILGVGHSMGAHALADAAASRPHRFQRLVLIDPVISPPEAYGDGGWTIAGREHPTMKRKNRFTSPEEMFERFKDRVPYAVFDRAVLWDYCRYGLLPADDGVGFVLACPPQIEASIYLSNHSNPSVHDSIRALEMPVLLLRAKEPPPSRSVMDFSSSPTWPGLVSELRNGREIHFADRTHFLPMEIPESIAGLLLGEIDS